MSDTALQVFLRRSNLTQATVARLTGISQSYLSELVRGMKYPSVRVAARLARVTKIPMALLFKGAAR